MAPLKTNLLLNSLFNSSFSAIKPLPGKKNNFQEVSARVNSQPMICRKPNNSGVEVGMNQTFPSVGKTQLPTPSVNSSFPAIKPLPGTKKNFPEVSGRVNSQSMTFRKPNENSSGVEVGIYRMFPSVGKAQLPKPRKYHDSSAVSACLKTADEDQFIERKSTQPTEVLTNPKGQYLRALLLRAATASNAESFRET